MLTLKPQFIKVIQPFKLDQKLLIISDIPKIGPIFRTKVFKIMLKTHNSLIITHLGFDLNHIQVNTVKLDILITCWERKICCVNADLFM